MSSDIDITEDWIHQMLAEAAQADMALARHVQALALASDEAEVMADLGRTHARLTRSVRQDLALLSKLRHEAERREREAAREQRLFPPHAAEPAPERLFPRDIAAADQRAGEIRTAVRRVIWSEGLEKSDYETERELESDFVRLLERWLVVDRLDDDFTEQPLDDQVAAYCATLKLKAENIARWRELPDPDPEELEACFDEGETIPPAREVSD